MAPIGGGPPVGSAGGTFTGPAQALEIYGDFAAAYSGDWSESTDPQTVIEFTTGNYYFVGTIQMGRNMKSTAETEFQLELNNQMAYKAKFDNGAGQTLVMPTQTPLPIIFPAYTKVKVSCIVSDSSDDISIAITGRIYR